MTEHLRIMVFIDGVYLRGTLEDKYKTDEFNPYTLYSEIVQEISDSSRIHLPRVYELKRIYFYDGEIQDNDDPRFQLDKEYHDNLRTYSYVEIKTGELIKTNEGYRKKGVDTLLSIDMITKAFLDHYDCAILVTRNRDFKTLVRLVKDLTGKRIWGAYLINEIVDDLKAEYDAVAFIQIHRIGAVGIVRTST